MADKPNEMSIWDLLMIIAVSVALLVVLADMRDDANQLATQLKLTQVACGVDTTWSLK